MQQLDAVRGSASAGRKRGDPVLGVSVRGYIRMPPVGLRPIGPAHHQRMPDDDEPGFFSARPKILILIGAVTGSLLMVVLVVAWFVLPRWAPAFVVDKSPWIGPAFEAAVHGELESEFRARLVEWGDGVVPAMCARLGSRDVKRRKFAIEILKHHKDPRSVEPLIAALSEPEMEVLPRVMEALGNLRDQRASAPMLKEIHRVAKYDGYVVRAAAFIVGNLAHPDLFDQVSATLLLPSQPAPLQALGCLALHGSADPRALTLLEERLGKASYPLWRSMDTDLAGEALGQSKQPGALAIIRRGLADGDADRRFGAVVAATYNTDASLLEPLLALAIDPDAKTARVLCQALAKHPAEPAVAAMVRMVEKGGEISGFAVSALGRNKSSAAVPALVSQLSHPESRIRSKVIDSLCLAADANPALIEVLMKMADDPDPKVALALKSAVWANSLKLTAEQSERLKKIGQ